MTRTEFYYVVCRDGKYMCFDRHAPEGEDPSWWGERDESFVCRFDTADEAARYAKAGDSIIPRIVW